MATPRNARLLWAISPIVTICLVNICAQAQTSRYIFLPDQSTLVQTGGIAGVQWTYAVEGQFLLALDSEAGTASFTQVDANAVDDSPLQRTLDPSEVFNMTALAGTIVDGGTSIRFEGDANDGSNVLMTLTFTDNTVTLKGQTTPPPNSADFFIFTLDTVSKRKYSGGTGEPNEPYQIATAEDLMQLGETPEDYDKHFILTDDIDLDPNLPGRKVFDKACIAPGMDDYRHSFIGTPFTGVFDGNSHTISNLTIKGTDYLGLFGLLLWGAEVKNLGTVDVNVTGPGDYIGGLAGWNSGNVTSCYSTGMVSGDNHGAGGLVGVNGGEVTNCYSTSKVNGDSYVGGLVGRNWVIRRIFHASPGLIFHCYSTGAITAREEVGGLLGSNNYDSGTGMWGREGIVIQCFWDTQTSGQAESAGGTGKTTAEMQTASTFLEAGWDFVDESANGTEDIWWIPEGKDYPRLWWELIPEN